MIITNKWHLFIKMLRIWHSHPANIFLILNDNISSAISFFLIFFRHFSVRKYFSVKIPLSKWSKILSNKKLFLKGDKISLYTDTDWSLDTQKLGYCPLVKRRSKGNFRKGVIELRNYKWSVKYFFIHVLFLCELNLKTLKRINHLSS